MSFIASAPKRPELFMSISGMASSMRRDATPSRARTLKGKFADCAPRMARRSEVRQLCRPRTAAGDVDPPRAGGAASTGVGTEIGSGRYAARCWSGIAPVQRWRRARRSRAGQLTPISTVPRCRPPWRGRDRNPSRTAVYPSDLPCCAAWTGFCGAFSSDKKRRLAEQTVASLSISKP